MIVAVDPTGNVHFWVPAVGKAVPRTPRHAIMLEGHLSETKIDNSCVVEAGDVGALTSV